MPHDKAIVCRSNIGLRGLSWDYAAWRYSLISPATAGFRRMDRSSATERGGKDGIAAMDQEP
jgi:hypothetical protein